MAEETGREALDARIKGWESDLERLRLALTGAPEPTHQAHQEGFVTLYRQKEVLKARWEVLRGTYQPEPAAVARCLEALTAMEVAWERARPMREALLGAPRG